jgi:hypothetical protein
MPIRRVGAWNVSSRHWGCYRGRLAIARQLARPWRGGTAQGLTLDCVGGIVRTVRKPGEDKPDPPGGRAAERARQFLKSRFGPDAELPPELEPDRDPPDEPGDAPDVESEDQRRKEPGTG